MKFCPYCSTNNPDGYNYCINCRKPLPGQISDHQRDSPHKREAYTYSRPKKHERAHLYPSMPPPPPIEASPPPPPQERQQQPLSPPDSTIPKSDDSGGAWIALFVVGVICVLIFAGIFISQHNDGNPTINPIYYTPLLTAGTVQLTSPADGIVFDNYPRTTTLRWNAPTEPVDYYCVHVQYYSGGSWHDCEMEFVYSTQYTFDFVGAQDGRWQVGARLETGEWGPWTAFRTFSYTV